MSHMRTAVLLALLFLGNLAGRDLTLQDAGVLVENTPDALAAKGRGGCPKSDPADWGPHLALVQLRNMCPTSGTGFIANDLVDLRTGTIWPDLDQETEITSAHLREVRKRLLRGRRRGSGHLP